MKPSAEERHRRSVRLPGFDYTQVGAYFITICSYEMQCIFGEVVNGEMWLSQIGSMVKECWDALPDHFNQIELDEFVVMPNHVHGILSIVDGKPRRGTACRAPTPPQERFGSPVSGSLPTIVRSFKYAATKRVNEGRRTPGQPPWQRNYYEHVIRNEPDLDRIRHYIVTNPIKWAEDSLNPKNIG